MVSMAGSDELSCRPQNVEEQASAAGTLLRHGSGSNKPQYIGSREELP